MFIFQMGPKLSLSGGRGESKTYFQPPEKKKFIFRSVDKFCFPCFQLSLITSCKIDQRQVSIQSTIP